MRTSWSHFLRPQTRAHLHGKLWVVETGTGICCRARARIASLFKRSRAKLLTRINANCLTPGVWLIGSWPVQLSDGCELGSMQLTIRHGSQDRLGDRRHWHHRTETSASTCTVARCTPGTQFSSLSYFLIAPNLMSPPANKKVMHKHKHQHFKHADNLQIILSYCIQ